MEAKRVDGGFDVSVGGRTYRVSLRRGQEHGTYGVRIDGRDASVRVEESSESHITLVVRGHRFTFDRPHSTVRFHNEQSAPLVRSDPASLPSPMPGRIISVVAKSGKSVRQGDPLVIIESMKMESIIKSPRAGEILEVLVKEGEAVKRGQALVRFA